MNWGLLFVIVVKTMFSFQFSLRQLSKNKSCVLYCYISLLSMFSMSRYFVKQNMNDVHFGRWWDNFKDWAVSKSVDKQMGIASLLLFMDFCWFANNTWSFVYYDCCLKSHLFFLTCRKFLALKSCAQKVYFIQVCL